MPAESIKPTKTERRILAHVDAMQIVKKAIAAGYTRYQPGDVLEQPSGQQYVVQPDGSWKRVK